MSTLSRDELNLQRLLIRTKKLCRENLNKNIWGLRATIKRLEILFSRLQDNRDLDNDLLMQYGRDVHQLRILVEAQQKETPADRLKWIDLIPNAFPQYNSNFTGISQHEDEKDSSISMNFEKAKNKAIYTADLRKQLLGGTEKEIYEGGDVDEVIQRESGKQEELAEELRAMAMLMKHTYSTANAVIKQDNATLNRLQETAERNQSRLEVESRRLGEHAYRSWCDCMYIFGVIAVIFSFIAMTLIMRVFKKKYPS